MSEPHWTLMEAVEHLDPPIKRRTLSDLLAPHRSQARKRYGRAGRPAWAYPVSLILKAHRDWLDRHRE